MDRTTRCLLVFAACVLAVRPTAAADSPGPEHPIAGSQLLLSDGTRPAQRRIVFKGRFSPGPAMDNPAFAGATLRVYGANATDGDTGVIQLDQAKWHALGKPAGSKGYVYRDRQGSAGGVELLMVKQGKHGGVLRVVGGSANWHYDISGPQGAITLTFTVGKARWCSELARQRFRGKGGRRITGHAKEAPASCPCEHFTSTFAAIQATIFERHQCTQAACHGSAPGQGGLDLRAEVSFANLVGVPSTGEPDKQRVAIGLPRDSELFRKLAKGTENLAGVPGAAMPSGLPAISASELEAVRLWIHSGAPEKGVVVGTENLLGSCLPPADPIKIPPPPAPALDEGVQLHAPPWTIPPRDPSIPGHDGEDEVCYATWYDFSATIPDSAKAPCPKLCLPGPQGVKAVACQTDADCSTGQTCTKIFGTVTDECFFYDKTELTQDPDSHHSIIHLYTGQYDVSSFGPFSCLGGPNPGVACDPRGGGTECGEGGGCAGKVFSSIACIGYGPPDFGGNPTGSGSATAPAIGGSQQPVSSNVYPDQVFAMLPVKGTIVWNSHAFNLTQQVATNEQWLNLYFAPPDHRVYPVQGIFDDTDIFVENVPPFEKHEYCRTYTLPQHARLFQFSSHTHKRGELFRIWGPGITDSCGRGHTTPAADCPPEPGEPIFTTTIYSDPEVLYFDPPTALDGADGASRTYKFCSRYDNGADDPSEVKRWSTSPLPPAFAGFESIVGGPCPKDGPNATIACLDGPHKGQLCYGNAACDSSPGLGDGVCDACPVHGGVTTEDEMFILLGLYYVVP